MSESNIEHNRHQRRAYATSISKLVRIRMKLGQLGYLPKISPLTAHLSVVEEKSHKKLVVAAYKAWHNRQLCDKHLKLVGGRCDRNSKR